MTCFILIGCQTNQTRSDIPTTSPERPQDIIWCGMPPILAFEENRVIMDERSFITLRCIMTDLLRWKKEAELLLDFYEVDTLPSLK